MNLSSCQVINEILPIDGADSIELAKVLGWQVVVKKGEFSVGDKVCYIQIDTVCPETDQFEFLRDRKFRIKTIKLRKTLSQGLIVPLPPGKYKEGEDLTSIMNIKKYEKIDNNPIEKYEKPRMPKEWSKKIVYLFKYNYLYKWFPGLRNKNRSPFPTNLVSITDEERIQNCPRILEDYRGKDFVVSYKLDGSSITIIHNKGFLGKSKYRICSRKFELHSPNNDWHKVFNETNFSTYIDKLVKYYNTNDIIVQGEAIGKFNGNHHGLSKDQIRLFNIYVNGKRLNQREFYIVCDSQQIPACPIHSMVILDHTLESILALSDIKDFINPKVPVEGLVWRCVSDNLSFKVINNNYLLHEK